MLDSLKLHTFGVRAVLEKTTVLAFAAPQAELRELLPSFLEPDTFQDRWGFVAMAIVHTRQLRPAMFPPWLGQDFWLIGYRIFVRYRNVHGRRLRGLYIIGSETNERRMAWLGDRFTHYHYTHKPMTTHTETRRLALQAVDGSTVVEVSDPNDGTVQLPTSSVFTDWTEARRFVGPLPFTFSHERKKDRVLIVEGSRMNWIPRPVAVERYHSAFLASLPISELRLSNAFMIDRVSYQWKRGVLEPVSR